MRLIKQILENVTTEELHEIVKQCEEEIERRKSENITIAK